VKTTARRSDASAELSELVKQLSEVELDDPCASFPDNLLERFAYHHVEKRVVAVRLGLPGSGPCRDALTQLGLLLPIPAALAQALGAAAEQREGFLMKDASSVSKGRTMLIEFGSSAEELERARESRP
jgi:hypothetical protein